jgi:hypothetical protein
MDRLKSKKNRWQCNVDIKLKTFRCKGTWGWPWSCRSSRRQRPRPSSETPSWSLLVRFSDSAEIQDIFTVCICRVLNKFNWSKWINLLATTSKTWIFFVCLYLFWGEMQHKAIFHHLHFYVRILCKYGKKIAGIIAHSHVSGGIGWGRTIPFPGIHTFDFRHSVLKVNMTHSYTPT